MSATATDLFAHAFDDPKHDPFTFPGDVGGALLVHGFPGTPNDMRALGDALNALGWETQGILLPGFGKDIGTLPERRMEDWANAGSAALRDLKSRHARTLLIGHSMGGALSLQVAANEQPDGLILLAPFWKINGWLWRALPVLQPVFRKVKVFSLQKLDFNDPETRRGIRRYLPDADLDDPQVQQAVRDFTMPTRIINELRRAGLTGHQRAPGVRAKTLVLQGTHDNTVTPALTRMLITALPQPPRYVEVEEGHLINDDDKPSWPTVERETLDFAAALLKNKSKEHQVESNA